MQNETCGCQDTDNMTGCLVCGRELYCTPDKPWRTRCYYCGQTSITHVFCLEGHYVCDNCHSRGILDLVERECLTSDLTDPVALALKIYAMPKLHMHGPEYHSIVPAVLVTAYGNSIHRKEPASVKEALERGKAVFGGICGTHGACGAAIGVGIAYAVIHQVTPYSREARGLANRMTALALTEISRFGGPRCCKRDSMTAIECAKKYLGCFTASDNSYYRCSQFTNNDLCIRQKCPYFPGTETERTD